MKTFLFISALIVTTACNAQRSIDKLFQKYSDREGFTCITVSGNLLNIATRIDDDNGRDKDIEAKITEVRILAQKDEDSEKVNFFDLLMRDLDTQSYEEMMSVKDYDHDMKMLVKTQGRRVKEFLLVTGGDNNAIIQVKGDMSISDAKRICDNARKHHGLSAFDVD